jgi:hypothetical protein
MGYTTIIWDLDDNPDGNVQHIAEHDLTKEEVEDALAEPEGRGIRRSSGLPIIFGTTSTGRFIAVVFSGDRQGNRQTGYSFRHRRLRGAQP